MEYFCNICNKKYASYKSLWKHNKSFHSEMHINITEKDRNFQCEKCNKKFTRKDNLKNHIENTCKNNKQNDNKDDKIILLENEIKTLKESMEELKKSKSNNIINNNTTNNNNTNIQKANNIVNITLNNFGNESYDHITDDFLKKCIMNNVSGVKSLIEKIHFSEEAPENKNVRLRSIKNNLVEISNNAKWVVKDANEAMETMIHKGCKILNGYYNNPQSGLLDEDLNELDTRIQNFLLSIMDKNNKYYFTLRRRILALLIEHSDA